ncbi:MAG: transketolase, partial [Clostridia bacterium]|nr:transketolase [Clostridia bacterium]
MAETPDYRSIAREIRRRTLVCIGSIGQGHIGGSLSVAEILAVLYYGKMRVRPEEPSWPDRDILVLSKGHAGPALYSVLTMKGYFPEDWLKTLNKPETLLPSHCDMRRTPGVDMTTGSLGQGASAACGFALAQKMDGRDARTFAILGDGEMEEGEVWESFLFASQKKLSNLCVFVDFNNLQIDGTVDEICSLGDLCAKFRSFGFGAYEV